MTTEGEERPNNKVLVGILSGLVVVIVGLVIGIVVVKSDVREEEEFTPVLPEELMGDDLSPTDQVIKETSIMLQDPNISDTEIEKYYDDVINDAIIKGDTGFAIKIIIQKMNFLAVIEGNCERANEYVDNIDLSAYIASEKRYLASYVISMAATCDNQDLQNKWEGFIGEWNDD